MHELPLEVLAADPSVRRQMTVSATFCLVCMAVALAPASVVAHPMSGANATFVQGTEGAAIGPFIYLGAKHMMTGYDHLLFLVGMIFFFCRQGV